MGFIPPVAVKLPSTFAPGGFFTVDDKGNPMGLRSLFKKRTAATGYELPAPPRPEPERPSPQQMAELQEAWAELTQVVEEAGVVKFRACTPNGTSWQEDPQAVRGITATLRRIHAQGGL